MTKVCTTGGDLTGNNSLNFSDCSETEDGMSITLHVIKPGINTCLKEVMCQVLSLFIG